MSRATCWIGVERASRVDLRRRLRAETAGNNEEGRRKDSDAISTSHDTSELQGFCEDVAGFPPEQQRGGLARGRRQAAPAPSASTVASMDG